LKRIDETCIEHESNDIRIHRDYVHRGRFKRRSLDRPWKVRDVRPRSTIYVSSQSCLRTRLSARTLHIPAVEVSYRLFLLPLWPQILLHVRVHGAAVGTLGTRSANAKRFL